MKCTKCGFSCSEIQVKLLDVNGMSCPNGGKHLMQHEAPQKLWFHFHPNPMNPGATDADPEVLADHGELWEQPYPNYEAADKELRRKGGDKGQYESSAEAGWIVIGPYVHTPLIFRCKHCQITVCLSTEYYKGPLTKLSEFACPRVACQERNRAQLEKL